MFALVDLFLNTETWLDRLACLSDSENLASQIS